MVTKKFLESGSVNEFFNDASFEDYYNNSDFKNAFKILTDFLRKDPDLYHAYKSNIAASFIDAFFKEKEKSLIFSKDAEYISIETVHAIANTGADNFLKLLTYEDSQSGN